MKVTLELTPEEGVDRIFKFDCTKEQFKFFVAELDKSITDISQGSREQLTVNYEKTPPPQRPKSFPSGRVLKEGHEPPMPPQLKNFPNEYK